MHFGINNENQQVMKGIFNVFFFVIFEQFKCDYE